MSMLDTLVLLFGAMGIIFIFLSDDSKSIEEYIRRHPEEFNRGRRVTAANPFGGLESGVEPGQDRKTGIS